VTNNPPAHSFSTPDACRGLPVPGRGPVTGFGASPLGMEGTLRLSTRWRGYVASAAGFVWFTREVPIPDASRFNYTFEIGGGVIRRLSDSTSVRIGYKFHHLSNYYHAPQNPGLDADVFLVGVQRTIGRH